MQLQKTEKYTQAYTYGYTETHAQTRTRMHATHTQTCHAHGHPDTPFVSHDETPPPYPQAIPAHPVGAVGPVHAGVCRPVPVQQHAAVVRVQRLFPDGPALWTLHVW